MSVNLRPLHYKLKFQLVGLLRILFCNIYHGFLKVKINREMETISGISQVDLKMTYGATVFRKEFLLRLSTLKYLHKMLRYFSCY